MPAVSVIIPAYNREHTLARAVDSVLDQSFRDFELILVDDGSTDGTTALAKQYSGRIRYIRQENRGVSAARNRGIRESRSSRVAFLDSDDLWHRDKLRAQFDYIEKNPETRLLQTDEIWIRRGVRVNPREIHRKRSGYIFPESLELCLISPSAVIMDRPLFDEYGLFDEKLPACEDYDLWLRVTPDVPAGLIPEFHVTRYGGHPGQLSSRYWGMDRFRVYSILKLLSSRHELQKEYRARAKEAALEKLSILINGSRKRGKSAYADSLEEIRNSVTAEAYSSRDYRILLEKQYRP